MTPHEAIQFLKETIAGCHILRDRQLKAVCEESINALEKQIPKKPIDKTLEYDGYYGKCPDCKKVIYDYKDRNRCYNCGQALDWRDEV